MMFEVPQYIKDLCQDMLDNPQDWDGGLDTRYCNSKKHVGILKLMFGRADFIRTDVAEWGDKLTWVETRYIKKMVKKSIKLRMAHTVKERINVDTTNTSKKIP